MSRVYDLPLISAGSVFDCWLIAAAVVACCNSDRGSYDMNFVRYRGIIVEHYSSATFAQWVSKSQGLPPEELVRAYGLFGFSMHREIKAAAVLADEDFANELERVLKEFDPLIFVRPSLGSEAIHAEAVVGIIRTTPDPDHGNATGIWVITHNSAYNFEQRWDISDFREFLRYPISSLWYNNQHHAHPREVARKSLREYDCIDSKISCCSCWH